MDSCLSHFKIAEACSLYASFNVAFKAETKNYKPVCIASCPAFLNSLVNRIFADRSEFGPDIEICFRFALFCLIETFGVKDIRGLIIQRV